MSLPAHSLCLSRHQVGLLCFLNISNLSPFLQPTPASLVCIVSRPDAATAPSLAPGFQPHHRWFCTQATSRIAAPLLRALPSPQCVRASRPHALGSGPELSVLATWLCTFYHLGPSMSLSSFWFQLKNHFLRDGLSLIPPSHPHEAAPPASPVLSLCGT